ncbi:uncharacterized protein [Nicotiana sylvestris]|uniref:uncharacterized protein n=1 Tax=Nicotiana sylvestris TaxID=4096 RepID=UPI00388C9D47
MEAAGTSRVTELHELEEFKYLAFESTRLYKERMKRLHDQNIVGRNFKPGDMVLLYNSRLRLFPGKLKSRWSGPFRVVEVFQSGAVDVATENDSRTFRVNGQRLKLYVGSDYGEFEHKCGSFDHSSGSLMPYHAFYMLSMLNSNMLLEASVMCF